MDTSMQPDGSLERTMSQGPSMLFADLHARIDEIASRAALLAGEDPDVNTAEEHASEGCSVCARALVNARDIGAEMAFLTSTLPSADLRDRLLERAQWLRHAAAGRAGEAARGAALPSKDRELKVFDPSGTIAHKHITGPDEADRAREVVDLSAHVPWAGAGASDEHEPMERMLVQVDRLLGFPLYFVSVIRGDRVGYRVQRGLSPEAASFGGMRREMTFCTHCVSSGAPLVVKNSAAEPFFRGNPAVSRHRIRAYVGVPLRTSRGIAIGTLCALDYRPREISPEDVRVLELFARRAVAELERPRGLAQLSALLLSADAPRGEIYRRGFFEELLSIELSRLRSSGRASSLVIASGCPREGLAALAGLLRDGEVAGELADGAVGILLSGSGAAEAEARCAALTSSIVMGVAAGSAAELSSLQGVSFAPKALEGAFGGLGSGLDS